MNRKPRTSAERRSMALPDAEARRIIAATATRHNCRVADMTSHSRKRSLVRARWAAMGQLYLTGFSQHRIGRFLCRDHSTVHYGLAKLQLIGLPR